MGVDFELNVILGIKFLLSLTEMPDIVSAQMQGKISFCVLLFALSTEPLPVNLISDSSFSTKLRGYPLCSAIFFFFLIWKCFPRKCPLRNLF